MTKKPTPKLDPLAEAFCKFLQESMGGKVEFVDSDGEITEAPSELDEALDRLSYTLDCIGEAIDALPGGREYDPEQSQEDLQKYLADCLRAAYGGLKLIRRLTT